LQKNGSIESKIVAPDGGTAGDRFGFSIAVSEEIVVVGSPGENTAGVVYMFHFSGSLIDELKAPDGTVDDKFGFCVAISGNTIVVGAPGINSFPTAGAAYLFSTSGLYRDKIMAVDDDGKSFGFSVSVSENTVVVGQFLKRAVFLFSTDGIFLHKIVSPGSIIDQFGWSVSTSQDIIVIGAPHGSAMSQGAAYIYAKSGTYIDKLVSPDESMSFGFSVFVSGDRNLIVVGSPFDFLDIFQNLNVAGAYVFTTTGNFVEKIEHPSTTVDIRFGLSVSVGEDSILVGAPLNDNSNAIDTGAVYIFYFPLGTAPSPQPTLSNVL